MQKKKELIQAQTKIKRYRRKTMYFTYGEKELDFLRQKDKQIGRAHV